MWVFVILFLISLNLVNCNLQAVAISPVKSKNKKSLVQVQKQTSPTPAPTQTPVPAPAQTATLVTPAPTPAPKTLMGASGDFCSQPATLPCLEASCSDVNNCAKCCSGKSIISAGTCALTGDQCAADADCKYSPMHCLVWPNASTFGFCTFSNTTADDIYKRSYRRDTQTAMYNDVPDIYNNFGADRRLGCKSDAYCQDKDNKCDSPTDHCNPPDKPCQNIGLHNSCQLSIVGENCMTDAGCESGICIDHICCSHTNGAKCNSNCLNIPGCNGKCSGSGGTWECKDTGLACGQAQECCNVSDTCLSSGVCGACIAGGQLCKNSLDCCSGNCDATGTNPTCLAGQACCTCAAVGHACTNSVNCCGNNSNTDTNICLSNNTCGACLLNNTACKTGLDCCSNSCQQNLCACAITGATCVNNSGCCSGICTDGLCQAAPVGSSCANNSDCSTNNCASIASCDDACQAQIKAGTAPTYSYASKCTCMPIGNKCVKESDCCGALICLDGTCNCVPKTGSCQASHECCEGTDKGHLACIDNICQPLSELKCPVSLRADLANIQTRFMDPDLQISTGCAVAYELLIYNYTLFAQYLTLVLNNNLACDDTLNLLINSLGSNIVVFQANCNTDSSSTGPQNFMATKQIDALNQQFAKDLVTAENLFNHVVLNKDLITKIIATNYSSALQVGTFTGNFDGFTYNSGATAECQSESSNCTCAADVNYVAFGSSCISTPCCVGDINQDLNRGAAEMVVNVIDSTVPVVKNYLVTPILDQTKLISASNSALTQHGQYAFIADRFLSLMKCWLANLPASCPAITANLNQE